MCCFAWFGWSIAHHFQKYTADRQESLSHGSIVRLQAIVSKLTQLLRDKPAEKVTESVAKDAIARWSESATTPCRGHQNRKGTKTGKSRVVNLPDSTRSMLMDRFDRLSPKPEDLVFPSPKGLAIDDHRFRARAWKTILESCHIEYRTPYNLCHSAASHSLASGVSPIALAEQMGHSKRVLLSTYAHAVDRKCAFVDTAVRRYVRDTLDSVVSFSDSE